MRYSEKRDKLGTKSYVPFSGQRTKQTYCPLLTLIVTFILHTSHSLQPSNAHDFYRPIYTPETSSPPLTAFDHFVGRELSNKTTLHQPTPPLADEIRFRQDDANGEQVFRLAVEQAQRISPDRVRAGDPELLSRDFFAPIIRVQSSEADLAGFQADSAAAMHPEDLVDSGSGSDNIEESPLRPEESSPLSGHSPTPSYVAPEQMMTPIFGQLPKVDNYNGNGPVLVRRLPKLVATAGSLWRHTLPSDTFQDGDGDLRQLKSSLSIDQSHKSLPRDSPDKSAHWLKYEQSTQTLVGFPLESDVGHHSYILTVSDQLGNTANETIEVRVRPHQSSRAFTHLFTLNDIEISSNGGPIIETLAEIVKRISDDLYGERTRKSVNVHSYNLTRSSSGQTSLISLSWANSSLPINRCNFESVIAQLVDDGYLTPNWTPASLSGLQLTPSKGLIKALGPEFRPSTISIGLRGICANLGAKLSDDNSQKTATAGTGLRVKNRIGQLKWRLGQPIMYRIPDDVFVTDNGTSGSQANLTLLLHTIDGLTLDQDVNYNFLEFDQETRTIFGLPYEMTRHTGQRELLLSAKQAASNQVSRETFIFDVEAQDLTTINNRAFRMSLYFMARTNVFGPREQVNLSRRMINALVAQVLGSMSNDQASQEFTVIHIQKFKTESSIDNSATLSDPSNAWKYHDKIHLIDDDADSSTSRNENQLAYSYANQEGGYFYKLSWTNETIGHRGDCPVEVIKDNILYALERSMLDYVPPNSRSEDPNKNESVRFYERLRSYFEPELDLIHLRFEPMSACVDALELHDVGNSEVADMADQASEFVPNSEPETPPHYAVRGAEEPKAAKEMSPINSDEYWAIVVLIILVVAIIFVVMMLFLGLHTYRINQEKRFELQMKLAQARQNSMYLSSLVLADQVRPFELGGQLAQGNAKCMFVEEGSSRKPAILDNEKQFIANGHMEVPVQKPTAVQLTGQSIHTTPLKPNMTFTLDSIANLQNFNNNIGPDAMMMANQAFLAHPQRGSMTLNRRPVGGANQQVSMMGRKASLTNLSQSQSILTVASLGGQPQLTMMPQARGFYPPPLATFYETRDEQAGGG